MEIVELIVSIFRWIFDILPKHERVFLYTPPDHGYKYTMKIIHDKYFAKTGMFGWIELFPGGKTSSYYEWLPLTNGARDFYNSGENVESIFDMKIGGMNGTK